LLANEGGVLKAINSQPGYPVFLEKPPERYPITFCYRANLDDASTTSAAEWKPDQMQPCEKPSEDSKL
jgi:hypothetical protein